MKNLILKEVTGYEGRYLIREDGALFRAKDMFQLTPRIRSKGYLYYELSFKGKPKVHTVHGLVAKAFCDGYLPGLQINHKDGNKANNHFSNLEWVTVEENLVHAFQNDLIQLCKLSKEDVNDILERVSLFTEQISNEYGVGKDTVRRVITKPGIFYRGSSLVK